MTGPGSLVPPDESALALASKNQVTSGYAVVDTARHSLRPQIPLSVKSSVATGWVEQKLHLIKSPLVGAPGERRISRGLDRTKVLRPYSLNRRTQPARRCGGLR